jgi:hypothetical protein
MRVLLVMKRQISWQEQNLKIRSQDLNQLAASQLELRKAVREGLDKQKKKTLEIHNWTQTGKETYTRTLCQKNEGSVEAKQKPVKIDGRTFYRTPFQTGTNR